ncbi:hypothetical protein QAD02_023731 [Eretmocerus hayati]|uniref:Uncharacterized protein n=1 Tax=Eretmocerus hayati TaxID=131215 RepID=A0ACC2PWN3_9HYME|nr:hypothetical protein QAD02_023731 [Eretmocerus hayati]
MSFKNCSDHEYEPIGTPEMRMAISQGSVRMVAPVVKITDTDVVPVADSDDSIDDRYRFKSRALILEGDLILPLDGRIEDSAMDSRNLGDQTIDNSTDELDEPQHRLSRIRSRLKSIQKPTFSRTQRAKSKESAAMKVPRLKKRPSVAKSTAEQPPASPRADQQRASRMERFRMALPERPRFKMPDKSKLHLPDKSKFHIKKPNLQLPKSLSRGRKSPSKGTVQSAEDLENQVPATTDEPKPNSRRSIFDFSTYPRPKLFDRKSKAAATTSDPKTTVTTTTTTTEYVTSSPKESRAQSAEFSTFPRSAAKKTSLAARWAQRFGETVRGFHDDSSVPERSAPWKHPSLEKPRLSLKPRISDDDEVAEAEGEGDKLPWENTERVRVYDEPVAISAADERDGLPYADEYVVKSHEFDDDKEPVLDPRQHDEQTKKLIEADQPKKRVTLKKSNSSPMVTPEIPDDYHEEQQDKIYDTSFPPVDPRDFSQTDRTGTPEMSEDEECSSMRSDREIQQSSGSSCERRRRGVIEELDSDEFFLREKGISQENVKFHLLSEIRNALSARNTEEDDGEPPQRPQRNRTRRKRGDGETSLDSFDISQSPEKQQMERGGSLSSHRIVYQMDTPPRQIKDDFDDEPLDNIVVVKPERRKSRSSLRSQSLGMGLPLDEENIVLAPIQPVSTQSEGPPVPRRRKRLRRDQSSSFSIRTTDSALFNGYGDDMSIEHSRERIPPTPPPTPPHASHYNDELDFVEQELPAPVPPKRTRSHSRTGSIAPEDDRTSHGADSLPGDFGEEDLPRDYSSTSREPSLPGYAVIEKKEKPPRPPPPRRKKQDKFATAPRPSKSGPKRSALRESALRPAKSDILRKSSESLPFMDADYPMEHEELHKDLRSGEVLIKMQARPLPAPPRPPRHQRKAHRATPIRRSLPREITPDLSETVASTQTDPLPDDFVIEEEIMAAKLVMTPSRSGSAQVLISTERIPSPTSGSYKSLTSTPPIPPLPSGTQQRDPDRSRLAGDNGMNSPTIGGMRHIDQSQLSMLRSAIFSTDEPIRIPSLEVGDLKVDRLTVSQLEAYKVAASEIDAIVVSATEMSNRSETDTGIHPSILQELIAIRNQLEAVAASQPQSRPLSVMEDASTATSNERIDVALDELRRRPITRESSPLLIVQPSISEQEATTEMGRTIFPLSSSTTDLTSTSETITASGSPTIVSREKIPEPVIKITEAISEAITPEASPSHVDETVTRSVSRSRSTSPSQSHAGAVRQTASPVKSLPPVISVTPDAIMSTTTPGSNAPVRHVTSSAVEPQRAVISYSTIVINDESSPSTSHAQSREMSQSPPPPPSSPARQSSPIFSRVRTPVQYIAFPTSQIPPELLFLADESLVSSSPVPIAVEPSITDTSAQLLRALGHASSRSLRHFVDSVVSRYASEDDEQTVGGENKLRRVELALCALIILIASLIFMAINSPKTITHHHHWDYFNPPQ